MKKTLLWLALAALAGSAAAKLPPLSPEAKAKAEQAAARTAWQGKVDAYKLCLSQDRVAQKWRSGAGASGKPVPPAVTTPACADPGPFAAAEPKPIEAAGAHSPPATAATPPVTTPQSQAAVTTDTAPATAPPAAASAAASATPAAPAAPASAETPAAASAPASAAKP